MSFERLIRMNALRAQLNGLRDEIRCSTSPDERDVLLDEAVATFNRLRELESA